MIFKSLRYVVGLGVVGGLAVLLAPVAKAQVEVTGGQMTGEAAFFVPGTGAAGNVTLFDAAVQQLELETSNGITTTSIFVPSAASFTDNGDGTPGSADTGVLQGKLTGLAAVGGVPFAFSGRDTLLNFTLTSFSETDSFEGSLISATQGTSGVPIFLPDVQNVTVTTSGYSAAAGDLLVGDFEADLDNGLIDLPSLVTLGNYGSTPVSQPNSLARTLKFQFEGENISDYELTEANQGELQFIGEANKTFKIETVGDDDAGKFKIEGNIGAVDITLTNAQLTSTSGTFNANNPLTKYKIDGESEGYLSLFAVNSLGFSSSGESQTQFQFEQSGGVKVQGTSNGDVDFRAIAGVSSFDNTVFVTGQYQPSSDLDDDDNLISNCNICASTNPKLVFNNNINFGNNSVTLNQNNSNTVLITFLNSSNGNTFNFSGDGSGAAAVGEASGTTVGTGTTGGTGGGTTTGNVSASANANSANTNLFALAGYSTSGENTYEISESIRFNSSGKFKFKSKVKVNYREQGGGRYYLVTASGSTGSTSGQTSGGSTGSTGGQTSGGSTGSTGGQTSGGSTSSTGDQTSGGSTVVGGYQLVGPSSRCFPGLVGLRQLSQEELDNISDDDDTASNNTSTGDDDEDDNSSTVNPNTNTGTPNTNTGTPNTNTGDDDGGDDDDDNGDDDDDDDDVQSQSQTNSNSNANQGIGNGPEGADPGNSQPHGGSNDEVTPVNQ